MKKKEYLKPEIRSYDIRPMSIICGSKRGVKLPGPTEDGEDDEILG